MGVSVTHWPAPRAWTLHHSGTLLQWVWEEMNPCNAEGAHPSASCSSQRHSSGYLSPWRPLLPREMGHTDFNLLVLRQEWAQVSCFPTKPELCLEQFVSDLNRPSVPRLGSVPAALICFYWATICCGFSLLQEYVLALRAVPRQFTSTGSSSFPCRCLCPSSLLQRQNLPLPLHSLPLELSDERAARQQSERGALGAVV